VSDIFQEVQEEYRREQMAKLWSKYRVPLVAAAVGLLVAVAGYQGWVYWQNKVLDASSRGFETALAMMEKEHGQEKAAASAFAKLGHDGAGGYAFAAKLQEAAVRAAAGDRQAALAIYDQIWNDGGADALFAGYARIRAALLLVDSAPLKEIQKRLDPIAGSESAWRIEAEELLGYAHWRAGDKAEALRLLDLVKNNREAPDGTKRRAGELSALIAGGMTVADLKAAPTVPALGDLPLVPGLPTFDVPANPTGPTTPTTTPTP